MKFRKSFVPAFLVMAAFGLAASQAADISGDWEITVNTPRGEMTSMMKIVQKGETLEVTMTSPRGEETTGQGAIKGKDVEWTITRSTPRGEMTMTYKGTVEGATMKGEVEMGDFGSAEWKAAKES